MEEQWLGPGSNLIFYSSWRGVIEDTLGIFHECAKNELEQVSKGEGLVVRPVSIEFSWLLAFEDNPIRLAIRKHLVIDSVLIFLKVGKVLLGLKCESLVGKCGVAEHSRSLHSNEDYA